MTLVEKLDEVFSKYIRLFYADWKGEIRCYTCDTRYHWKEVDAGHFISRESQILRFEEDNVRPQCRDCNRFGNGMPVVFEQELRDELGDDRVDSMKLLKNTAVYRNDEWYESRIRYYTILVKGME
jgi:hypothetical protein